MAILRSSHRAAEAKSQSKSQPKSFKELVSRIGQRSQLVAPKYADDLTTSSTAATPGKKKHPWINVPRWSPLYRKLQQRSDKPLDDPSVDALHTGTDSSRSPSTELKPAPKDSRTVTTP